MFPNLKADQIIALNITQESDSIPFPMKDVFVKRLPPQQRWNSRVIGRQINN